MIAAGIKLEEIHDVAVSQSIVEVAQRSSQDQAQGYLQEPILS